MPVQEKVRVLVVDDISETRDNILRMLQFDMNIEIIGAAKSGKEAIELSQKLKPDVIIMDINMPDMDGITATETIRRKLPYVQVVILSVQSDPSYMRRAMLAGARDFLTKPPSIDEFTAAVRRAGAMAQDEREKQAASVGAVGPGGSQGASSLSSTRGKVIAIYSPKGGTGATTIAVNFALALKAEDNKVALIDANMQFGDVAVLLNEQAKNSVLDLTPRVDELDKEVIEDVFINHAASGIRVLAAPPRPEMAESVLADQFEKLIQYLRQIFTYIVIDAASYLTDVVLSGLESADQVILITTQDIPSIKNCSAFLSLADGIGIKRDRILFIMNRYDKRITISPERVGESLHQEIVTTIPFDDRMVSSSVNRGVPFMIDNKAHPIAKSIQTLVDLTRDRLAKAEEVPTEPALKK
ncbi:MAG: response regulator [Anaerolineaceae bacterium]|nr:response regulator [Anaerolineaceae bacterium]